MFEVLMILFLLGCGLAYVYFKHNDKFREYGEKLGIFPKTPLQSSEPTVNISDANNEWNKLALEKAKRKTVDEYENELSGYRNQNDRLSKKIDQLNKEVKQLSAKEYNEEKVQDLIKKFLQQKGVIKGLTEDIERYKSALVNQEAEVKKLQEMHRKIINKEVVLDVERIPRTVKFSSSVSTEELNQLFEKLGKL